MRNIILSMIAATSIAAPALADPIKEEEFFTNHAMGCMLLQECTDHVQELKTVDDLNKHEELADIDYSIVADEFNSLVRSLNKVGAKVFLADLRYFPVGHRGVYHTVSNNFFLNVAHMHRPGTMMSVMRHEGWHAAQDCMAGTIDNNFIAIIRNQEDVPKMYQAIAKSAYMDQPHAIPWEKEAYWAGHTEGMTAAALESCARGTMWTDYEPTPMTREWLEENNYLPHIESRIEYDFYFDPRGYHRHHYQRHNHVHYHWRKDIVHSHKHSHGEGYRHHGKSSRHLGSKFHFH